MSDEEELPEYQYEEEYLVEEWEDWLKPFSPPPPHHLHHLPPLLHVPSPILTLYEVEKCRWKERISVTQSNHEEPSQVIQIYL